ncbi:MAG: 4-hydroxy-tetrahydrodipicolinate reductase [Spirochaetaceae bacterium]|nr:MAG: 4-hydroxy-tetrahydrodipicolinate reductase [Spirochaetaceae bacterium]
MNVALCGYGRMGREIEQVLISRGHTVATRIDPSDAGADVRSVEQAPLQQCDAVIEFAHADGVVTNARAYVEAKVDAVIGTTGWENAQQEVGRIVGTRIGYVLGSNFSVGANLFFRMVAHAAGLADAFDEYDVALYESHHNRKADSPSGTALTLALTLLSRIERKTEIVDDTLRRPIQPGELHVASMRIGSDPGTHTVSFDSSADTIELRHRARNRGGFALGAVRAAEWISGRHGFFTVDDMMNDLLERTGGLHNV